MTNKNNTMNTKTTNKNPKPPLTDAVSSAFNDLMTIKCGRCFQSAPVMDWCKAGGEELPRGEHQCPRCGYAFRRQPKEGRKPWEPFIEVIRIETRPTPNEKGQR